MEVRNTGMCYVCGVEEAANVTKESKRIGQRILFVRAHSARHEEQGIINSE